nr:TIGR03668 family PPOX class F420-dependent oxidoreductase [Pseudonocardia spinosispora]
MTEIDARARFTASRHAYLATVDGAGQPHLVPVTFAVDGGTVLIAIDHKPKRSTDLKRLRNIEANERVSLLVDEYDDDWSKLWWVRADGTARVLTEPADRSGPLRLLAAKYPIYADRVPSGPVISIDIRAWTGWAYGSGNSPGAGSTIA